MNFCPVCGGSDIATTIDHFAGMIPSGTYRFDGCRTCSYWQESVSTKPTPYPGRDMSAWKLLTTGQGLFSTVDGDNSGKRAATWQTYNDPSVENDR
jgi:hypothetical protein